MPEWFVDAGTVVIGLLFLGFCITAMLPDEFQTKTWWLIVSFSILPLGLVVMGIFTHPFLMIPLVFSLGVLCAWKPRRSR